MAGKLNKFQMLGFQAWNPHISKVNHISAIYQTSPQKATNLMVNLLAWHKGKTLDTYLSKFPTKEFDTDDEYTWDVVGSTKRNIPLIEARDENGTKVEDNTNMTGAGTAPFYLVFAEDWFNDGEVIVGNLNEVYPMRILGDARMEGSNAVYRVELMGGNTAGIPNERLQAGERFSVEYAPVERELSRKVGGVRFSSPVAMRNEFSTIRMYHKVSGALLDKKLAVGVPVTRETTSGYKADTVTMWMHEVEWQFEQEWNSAKNNILAFGRSNRNSNGEYMNIGKSGEVIRMGAGLYEQMEVANTSYYNTFSIKVLEDALYELSAAKLDMRDRTFIIRTGERGAIQFHKAVRDEVSGWSMYQLNGDALNVVKKVASPLHETALSAGYQFVEYLAPNGVKVKLEIDHFYDDPVRNKIQHPNGGPAFSYRYDIFDIGTMDQPNIFKVGVKGKPEYRGYQWGLRNPWTGQMNNTNMSYDEDSASMHRMASLGICVLDPTRTMSLIPAVLQG